jgi:hypothetical protein
VFHDSMVAPQTEHSKLAICRPGAIASAIDRSTVAGSVVGIGHPRVCTQKANQATAKIELGR